MIENLGCNLEKKISHSFKIWHAQNHTGKYQPFKSLSPTRMPICTHAHSRTLNSPYCGAEPPRTPSDFGSNPRQKSETRERVSWAIICRCSASVLMNSIVRFHIIIYHRTFSLSSPSIAASPHPSNPTPSTHSLRKACFPTIVGTGGAAGQGLGGRVGKTLQTRREQMPET